MENKEMKERLAKLVSELAAHKQKVAILRSALDEERDIVQRITGEISALSWVLGETIVSGKQLNEPD